SGDLPPGPAGPIGNNAPADGSGGTAPRPRRARTHRKQQGRRVNPPALKKSSERTRYSRRSGLRGFGWRGGGQTHGGGGLGSDSLGGSGFRRDDHGGSFNRGRLAGGSHLGGRGDHRELAFLCGLVLGHVDVAEIQTEGEH